MFENEKMIRDQFEKELNELKNRPPPITPRQQGQLSRSPSPLPKNQQKQNLNKNNNNNNNNSINSNMLEIYLPEYCPLTLRAVQRNRNILSEIKIEAIEDINEEFDEFGIGNDEKHLSINDYK
jgi:hypothetical protein